MLQYKASFHSDSWNESTSAPSSPNHLWDWATQWAFRAMGLSHGDVSPGRMKQPLYFLVQRFSKKLTFSAPLPANSKSFSAFFPFLFAEWYFFLRNIQEQFFYLFLPTYHISLWDKVKGSIIIFLFLDSSSQWSLPGGRLFFLTKSGITLSSPSVSTP